MTKKKIQLVLDEEAQEVLSKLVESTKAESMAHVLRNALGVYSTLNEMLSCEHVVLALVDREKGEFQELNVPSLDRKHVTVKRVLDLKEQDPE